MMNDYCLSRRWGRAETVWTGLWVGDSLALTKWVIWTQRPATQGLSWLTGRWIQVTVWARSGLVHTDIKRVRNMFIVWVGLIEVDVKLLLLLTLGGLLFILGTLALRPRWVCSWSNSRSSSRWVKASFCWMAMRRREFNVFFSSSAAASCLCISSSWVTYSSHLYTEG